MRNFISLFFTRLLLLPRGLKRILLIFSDIIILEFTIIISYSIRYDRLYFPQKEAENLLYIVPILGVIIFYSFGLYKNIIRYIEFDYVLSIIKAVTVLVLSVFLIVYIFDISRVPRSFHLINWAILIIFLSSFRMVMKSIFLIAFDSDLDLKKLPSTKKNILIYGAGSKGRQLSASLKHQNEYELKSFIDDNLMLSGRLLSGVLVSKPDKILFLIKRYRIQEIVIAISNISREGLKKIINSLSDFPVRIKIYETLNNDTIYSLRNPSLDDLVMRSVVQADRNLLDKNIKNKSILITGAGGSIGSELCREIIKHSPKNIVLYDNSEYNLYSINKEITSKLNKHNLISVNAVLGSISDKNKICHLIKDYKVDSIYHAAAYKHVPLVESNINEGVINNILGTYICAQAAIESNIENFVLISTDKAVRPTNVMGATKRLAELVVQAMDDKEYKNNIMKHNVSFSIVRFGNVIGSSGSVVPEFQKLIDNRLPLTITHPDIIRYFMSIKEAAQLVIQAAAMKSNADVFVLDMGEPIKIIDLAKKMIRLNGLQVKDETNKTGDIEIKYIGLRPGEKLYEETIIGNNVVDTEHPSIKRANEEMIPWHDIEKILEDLIEFSVSKNSLFIKNYLNNVLDDYVPYDLDEI